MIYLKLFENHTQYTAYTASTEFIKPNVSHCIQEAEMHYNPWVETRLVVYYDIQDISSPTTVCTNYDGTFKSMEIDGVDSVDITAQGNITYQFGNVGEHVIKYELNGLNVGTNAPLFNQLSTVKRVVIPNTFTSVGDYAFYNCSGLTSCTIGGGITSIGANAFYMCINLTSINIPSGVTSIGASAFYHCSSLTSIDIPSGVTSIGDSAFYNCSGFTSIVIPNGVTSIGSNAFKSCNSLSSCTIGSSVTSIGDEAFSICVSLTSIDIPDSVTSIGQKIFYACSLTSCTIGSGVTSIGDSAFYGCSSLTSITSNATTAPIITSYTFLGVTANGTLYVPIGSSGYDTWMGTGDYYLGKYNWTKVEQ